MILDPLSTLFEFYTKNEMASAHCAEPDIAATITMLQSIFQIKEGIFLKVLDAIIYAYAL